MSRHFKGYSDFREDLDALEEALRDIPGYYSRKFFDPENGVVQEFQHLNADYIAEHWRYQVGLKRKTVETDQCFGAAQFNAAGEMEKFAVARSPFEYRDATGVYSSRETDDEFKLYLMKLDPPHILSLDFKDNIIITEQELSPEENYTREKMNENPTEFADSFLREHFGENNAEFFRKIGRIFQLWVNGELEKSERYKLPGDNDRLPEELEPIGELLEE